MKKELERQEFLRIRKMKTWAPVVIVPLVVSVFILLGGGKGVEGTEAAGIVKGVNMTLPLANLDAKKGSADKMAIYKQAAQDSLKRLEQMKQDPYAASGAQRDSGRLESARGQSGERMPPISLTRLSADRQADSLMRRLAEMRKWMAAASGASRESSVGVGMPTEGLRVAAERAGMTSGGMRTTSPGIGISPTRTESIGSGTARCNWGVC